MRVSASLDDKKEAIQSPPTPKCDKSSRTRHTGREFRDNRRAYLLAAELVAWSLRGRATDAPAGGNSILLTRSHPPHPQSPPIPPPAPVRAPGCAPAITCRACVEERPRTWRSRSKSTICTPRMPACEERSASQSPPSRTDRTQCYDQC